MGVLPYVAEHIARAGDVPVVVVALPVIPPDPGGATVPFELPGDFLFLFAFDYFSTLQRKNPLGLVKAFTQAFEPGEGPALLLKTINAEFRPQDRERLRYAIGDREDVRMVDAAITPAELAALYTRGRRLRLSAPRRGLWADPGRVDEPGQARGGDRVLGQSRLHDAGQFVPRELDANSRGVRRPSTIRRRAPGQIRLLEHAAAQLRSVWEDQDEARRRGSRAAADMIAALSPQAVGAIARDRLHRIMARATGGTSQTGDSWPLAEVEGRARFDLAGDGAGNRGVRRLARRALFRVMRPYTSRERDLDEALVRSLRAISLELAAERAARQRDRQRLGRLERRLNELARGRD